MSDSSAILGILLILCGGACNGTFAVPTKKVTAWNFEHVWLIYCLVATILLPISVGVFAAPVLFSHVFPAHPALTAETFGFGALWGAGSFLFGLSLKRLGIAISDALTNGAVVLFGSTGPLLIGAASLSQGGVLGLSIGLSLLLLGIFTCAWASIERDRAGNPEMQGAPHVSSWMGIALAVLAGIVSSMLNIGFAHGIPLVEAAKQAGAAPVAASLAVWIPALIGGFFVNCVFTAAQIHKGGTWSMFKLGGPEVWARSFAMGAFWFAAIFLYGFGSPMLGHAGTVYGWAIGAGASILASSSWGFVMGEWARATWRAKRRIILGVILIISAAFLLARIVAGS